MVQVSQQAPPHGALYGSSPPTPRSPRGQSPARQGFGSAAAAVAAAVVDVPQDPLTAMRSQYVGLVKFMLQV